MTGRVANKIKLQSVDELLGAPVMKDGTELVKIKDIRPFKDHPFKVLDDDKMDELVESIRINGVLSPVLIRPRTEGGYEMISGHRRLHASEKVGLDNIPAIIKKMSDDEAVIAMVDSNVQREEILPSERAWSLKMKMDAMRRQGQRTDLTSGHDGPRLAAEEVGQTVGISPRQVKRFVRLTELTTEIMELVDQKKIGLVMAVDISFFNKEIQSWIYEYRRENGILLQSQIDALKELKNLDNLTKYNFIVCMNEALPEKKVNGRVNLSERKLNRYFPPRMTAMEREQIILELLEEWKTKQEQI